MAKLQAVDGSFRRTAKETVTTWREIDAPIARVWAAIDGDDWASWFPGMTQCYATSNPRTGLGASRTVKIDRLVAEEQFVTYEPEKAWGFSITKTNLPLAKRLYEGVELKSIDDGRRTRIYYYGAYDPTWLTRLARGPVQDAFITSWGNAFESLNDFVSSPA